MTSPEHVKQVKTTLNPAKQRSARINSCAMAKSAADVAACKRTIHIGIFFDGTDNNMKRDSKDGKKAYTNIASLFKAYKADSKKGYFKFYVPGVGTKFSKVGEYTESADGKSIGWGGGKRIYYAIFQILNTVNKKVNGEALFPDHVIKAGVSHPGIKDGAKSEVLDTAVIGSLTPKMIMARYIAKLNKEIANTKNKKPIIEEIKISIFGFSRGAAQARAFVNVFHQAVGESGKLCNIKTTFNFLGLFDTVASVQFPYSSPGIGGEYGACGLLSWANKTMKIHPNVKRCVHFVAGHEFRVSFPLSSIMLKDEYKENYKEVVYPGVHSDLGGGYAPGDQGKSINIGKNTRAEDRAKIEKKYADLKIKRKKAAEDSTKYFKKMREMYSDIYEKAVKEHGYHVGPLVYPKKYTHEAEAKEQKRLSDLHIKTWNEERDALKKFNKEYRIPNYNVGREYLLSQIPLRHMYEDAYDHVLPLMSYDEMKNKNKLVHDDFMVSTTVEALLSNYITIFEKNTNSDAHGPKTPTMCELQNIFYRSQELYLMWRWFIQEKTPLNIKSLPFYGEAKKSQKQKWFDESEKVVKKLKSYAHANAQEKRDKVEANKDYMLDMWEIFKQKEPKPKFSLLTSMPEKAVALIPYTCRKFLGMTKLIDHIAYDQIELLRSAGNKLDVQLCRLFDEFMHDSHAGFYIAGPRSAFEKKEFYETAKKKVIVDSISTPLEPDYANKFEKELVKSGLENFPLMTDENVSDLYLGWPGSSVQKSMGRTSCRPNTRREAGGHVKARLLMDSNKG